MQHDTPHSTTIRKLVLSLIGLFSCAQFALGFALVLQQAPEEIGLHAPTQTIAMNDQSQQNETPRKLAMLDMESTQ